MKSHICYALICTILVIAATVRARTLVADDFESYSPGVLDKNQPSSANPAPNGSGNPWWGPGTVANMTVVGAQNGATPHSGAQMIRGDDSSGVRSLGWQNIGFRYNSGQPFAGNLRYTFWFYDPNGATSGGTYEENSGIAFYSDAPSDTDYPASGTLSNSSIIDRLTLGAANFKSNTAGFPQTYDSTKYQGRLIGTTLGYDNNGWFNTSVTRSVGWHEGEIDVGPAAGGGSNLVSYYIDDLTTPVFTGTTTINRGYNTLEFTSEGTAVGYFDDPQLVTVPEPVSLMGVVMAPIFLRRCRRKYV